MYKKFRKSSRLLCAVLIAAMTIFTTGCGSSSSDKDNSAAKSSPAPTAVQDSKSDVTVLGEGKTTFTFLVTDREGNETKFEIHTDKENVEEALSEHNLIQGEEGDYGLYVKTVNGITADYDTDQTYWAFYVNGEYAQSGIESTKVAEGDCYSFKVEN